MVGTEFLSQAQLRVLDVDGGHLAAQDARVLDGQVPQAAACLMPREADSLRPPLGSGSFAHSAAIGAARPRLGKDGSA